MKPFIKFAIAFTAIAFAVSCQEIETPYGENEVHLKASLSYVATKGTSSSTSGIVNADSDQVLEIALARIDQNFDTHYPAFVNCGDKIFADMKAPDASLMRDIEFTSEPQFFRNGSDAIRYASWYPADGKYVTNADSTKVTFHIDGATDIMYGSVATGSKTSSFTTATFNHALCVYRFYVYAMLTQEADGSSASMAQKWGKLTSMAIANMPDSCVLTLPKLDGVTYSVKTTGPNDTIFLSDASNNIFYDPGDELPLGFDNKRLVAKCVAAAPASGILDIALTTEKAVATQQVSIARNFQAGCAYDVVLRFSDHGIINADVSVGEWNSFDEDVIVDAGTEMYYNLSTYGTANCYMIHSGNYGYSFTGTVMGNGNGSTVGVPNTTINPGYIDTLWSDLPASDTSFSLVSHQLSQGKVLINVKGKPNKTDRSLLNEGNVIIAAYTDDTKSTILWTWHIWLCDKVQSQGYTNGYSVQDRNLGAVSSIPESNDYSGMYGLYYQWGRPVPFKDTAGVTFNSSTTSVANAIANPRVFYGSAAGATDWNSSPSNALWGWISDAVDPVKTIYDPCPEGYSVSEYRMWQNMSDYEKQETYIAEKGVNVSIASHSIWYPFQGYMDYDGDINTSPHPLYLWSNSILGSNPYYFLYDGANNSTLGSSDGKRNIAAPVRCISSRGESVIHNLSASQTANCYMVHKNGYYKFNASVRGNGVYKLFPLGGDRDAYLWSSHINPVNITPARVDVLWWQGDFSSSLAGNITDPQRYMCINMLNGGIPDSDGYVSFAVDDFYKGNTILAAYDASDNILWTWHIWLTDKPEDIATGNYSLMDRFLGATFAPTITSTLSFDDANQRLATYGFYYQWGRKDPIPGPVSPNAGSPSSASSSRWWLKNGGSWTQHDDITVSDSAAISYVVAHPVAFYTSIDEAGNNQSGWFPAAFADAYTNVCMWGYAVEDWNIKGQTFTKTMHDPCPPGYRTPFHYAWDGTIDGLYSGEEYRYIAAGEAAGTVALTHGEAGFDSYGLVLNKGNFAKAWYPFAGYRYPKDGKCTNVGVNGWMFTGMPMGQYDTRYYQYNSSNTSQRRGGTNCGAAYGFSIRCQKE